MKKSLLLALLLASFLFGVEYPFDAEHWTGRVRGGAEGNISLADGKLTMTWTNDAGEVLSFLLKSHPAKPNTTYRFTVVVTGEPGGTFHLLNPPATKRIWPNTGPIQTDGKRQKFTFEMNTVDGEESFGTQLRLLSKGTYVFESLSVEELTPELKQAEFFAPVPANLLDCDWTPRIPGPAIAFLDITPKLLTVLSIHFFLAVM